jgi:hypothetical protein
MPILDVTPEKRLYLSVISEYDLLKAICELVDNAIDYSKKNRKTNLEISITIDQSRQSILIEDNAGGVPASELALLLSPGKTTNEISDNVIGYFGVGAKRAVVALAQDITIKTRFGRKETCKIHFDDDWINEVEEWELEYDILPKNIAGGTTIIELFKLRSPITAEDLDQLKTHLAEVYGIFIEEGVKIQLNGTEITPALFTNNWTYAKGYEPTSFSEKITVGDREIDVEIVCGLIDHPGDPDNSYGIFFYCNDRLITKGLTDFSVGFESGKVGNPHYNISLTRTIVKLNGQSRDMPWNSSKSGIDIKHHIFQTLRSSIINVTTNYAKISRALQGKWDKEIFPFTDGDITQQTKIPIENIPRNFLPTPPASKPRWAQRIIKANQRIIAKKIWAEGLQDSIIAADNISKTHLSQKNRIAIIILDSTLEIAYKEFLVNEVNIGMRKFSDICQNRFDVQKEVFKHIAITKTVEQQIDHYYRLRNLLIHQRATPNISDVDINRYRRIVEDLLRKMFGLRFQV